MLLQEMPLTMEPDHIPVLGLRELHGHTPLNFIPALQSMPVFGRDKGGRQGGAHLAKLKQGKALKLQSLQFSTGETGSGQMYWAGSRGAQKKWAEDKGT